MRRSGRSLWVGAALAAGLATSACSTDPAFWNSVARGLDQAAMDLEYENANCYWAAPPGIPGSAARQYCPGDYGYRDFYIPPESPYWRRRGDRDHRDHDRDRDGDRDRHDDRDHGRRGK